MEEIMVAFLLAGFSAIISIYIFLYTKKRDIVNKHPDSFIYQLFVYNDHLIESLIKKTSPSLRQSEVVESGKGVGPIYVDDLHEHLNINDVFSIKEAVYITFGFKSRLPDSELQNLKSRIRNTIGISFFLPAAAIVTYIALYAADLEPASGSVKATPWGIIALLIFLAAWIMSAALTASKVMSSYYDKSSFFSDIFALSLPDIPFITINDQMVFIHTPWSNHVTKIRNATGFSCESDDFRIGIYLKVGNEKVWVFRYPRFFKEKLLNEEGLLHLCELLNAEFDKKSNKPN